MSGECGSGEGGTCVSHQGRLLLWAGGMDSQSVSRWEYIVWFAVIATALCLSS